MAWRPQNIFFQTYQTSIIIMQTRSQKKAVPQTQSVEEPTVLQTTPRRRICPRKLEPEIRHQIQLDIEAYPSITCDQLLHLKNRPYLQLDIDAVRNRYNYLKKLKKIDPNKYWQRYSDVSRKIEASSEASQSPLPTSTNPHDSSPESSSESSPTAPTKQQTPSSPTQQSPPFSSPPKHSRIHNKKTTRNTIMSNKTASGATLEFRQSMFSSMKEAEEFGMKLMVPFVHFGFFVDF